jgi:hypothetical protein
MPLRKRTKSIPDPPIESTHSKRNRIATAKTADTKPKVIAPVIQKPPWRPAAKKKTAYTTPQAKIDELLQVASREESPDILVWYGSSPLQTPSPPILPPQRIMFNITYWFNKVVVSSMPQIIDLNNNAHRGFEYFKADSFEQVNLFVQR